MILDLEFAYLVRDDGRYILDSVDATLGIVYGRMITGFVNDTYLCEKEGTLNRQISINNQVKELPVSVASFQRRPSGQHSYVNVAIDLRSGLVFTDAEYGDPDTHTSWEVIQLVNTLATNRVEGDKVIQGLKAYGLSIPNLKLTRNYLGGYNLVQGDKHLDVVALVKHVHKLTTRTSGE